MFRVLQLTTVHTYTIDINLSILRLGFINNKCSPVFIHGTQVNRLKPVYFKTTILAISQYVHNTSLPLLQHGSTFNTTESKFYDSKVFHNVLKSKDRPTTNIRAIKMYLETMCSHNKWHTADSKSPAVGYILYTLVICMMHIQYVKMRLLKLFKR